MSPTDILVFSVTSFLALAALMYWRRRRMIVAQRVNRGLRGYVSGQPMERSDDEDLMVA